MTGKPKINPELMQGRGMLPGLDEMQVVWVRKPSPFREIPVRIMTQLVCAVVVQLAKQYFGI